ncbi:hypothetical protein BWO36_00500 [Staphylococcus haemolyticus]|nr:hypothetical protein BWO36_00500 [Staphylococcus haemolyticus]
MFISEIVHTKDSFLLKLYYQFNFATEPNFLLFSPKFVINDKSNISIYMLLKYNNFIFIIMIYKINEYYILAINIKTIFTAINTQKL